MDGYFLLHEWILETTWMDIWHSWIDTTWMDPWYCMDGYLLLHGWILDTTLMDNWYYMDGYFILHGWILVTTWMGTLYYTEGYLILHGWILDKRNLEKAYKQWKNLFINWPRLVQYKDIYTALIEPVIEPINPLQVQSFHFIAGSAHLTSR